MSLLSVLRSSFDHHRHRRHHHLLHLNLLLHPISLMFVISLAVQWTVRMAGASCNAVQSTNCLQAASGGSLEHLPGAGNCIVKPYFRYTHLCTVTNYLPSTDYCCCTFDARLLCCRYHQGWYHFRCMEEDDELEISAPSVSYTANSMEDLPLLTLLPVILCPLVAAAICIICITKCWCYRHDNDSSSSSSSSSPDFCCRCYNIVDDKNEEVQREKFASAADDDDVTSPLQHHPPPSPSAPPEVQPGPTSCPRPALHHPSCQHADLPLSPFYRRCDGPTPANAPCFLRGHPPPPRIPLPCPHHHHHHHHHPPVGEDFLGVVHPQCHLDLSRRGFCLRSLQCACAQPLSSAELRRHCDVIRSSVNRPANEQTTEACADCLPPAYESIQAESSAQL